MRILQVSTFDIAGGGAERVAWNLFKSMQARGHNATMVVGHKQSDDPDVLFMDEEKGAWHDLFSTIQGGLVGLDRRGVPGVWRLNPLVGTLAEPLKSFDQRYGLEDFRFPHTTRLLISDGKPPDIIHCHNLHGGYFDLRILPRLSKRSSVVLTLHDAWLLTGHCAHSFECERWQIGCGNCPDLTIYPSIKRDATAFNWRRKHKIYARSKLYVATPSRWLMRKVEESMLKTGVIETRVIPNGVDLKIYHPGDKQEARAILGLPQEATILLFTANGIRNNAWKDHKTMRQAVSLVADHHHDFQDLVFIALGEDAPPEQVGSAHVRFVPFQKSSETVARYYQAADVYLHAARVDTFPNTVVESMACGTPAVATAVGGIPEQIQSLGGVGPGSFGGVCGPEEATGILVSPGNAQEMAAGINALLEHGDLRNRLGENASRDARQRFDLEQQVNSYLGWYEEIVKKKDKPD